MKKVLPLILLFAVLVTGYSFAYSVKEESKMDVKGFKELLGDKFLSLDTFSVSLRFGHIFLLARDNKTRNLEWYLVNPFTKKVLKSGKCPFKAFEKASIAPDDSAALVFSRYPSGLWRLDLEKNKWNMVYKNPGKKKGGLAILPISPLFYMESYRAFSIFDQWDDGHFVIDTFVVSFTFDPFAINKVISLKNLYEYSIKTVFTKTPTKWQCRTDFLRFGEEMNILYILKTRSKDRKQYKDYLLHLVPPKTVTLVEELDGRITPLDYKTRPMKILYTAAPNDSTGKPDVIFKTDKGKTKLISEKVVTGKILKNDLIGLAAISSKNFLIYLGTPDKKMEMVKKFASPYRVGFINDGRKLILMNNNEIRCFRINKSK